jgi:ceramide glucosyltransferase
MSWWVDLLQGIALLPAVTGSVYGILCSLAVLRFCRQRRSHPVGQASYQAPVTVLKPVYGLEKHLRANLRSICLQDYPDYQVVFCIQDPNDPALPLVWDIQEEFGADRVSVVVADVQAGLNGKVNNLLGGLAEARHEMLVMTDSDVLVRPDYLRTIVAPLTDPQVGCVCTLFKVTRAQRWFEKLELLSINADFIPSVIFAHLTGASKFCLGPSLALRRSTLTDMGRLESLADFLVEDYELGRRIWTSGKRLAVLPYCVDAVVDLGSFAQWWDHQCYWDQNTWAARPIGFFATAVTRAIPFALLFAVIRLGDGVGLAVLGAAVALRLAPAGALLQWGIRDCEGTRSLALLPLRDLFGMLSWAQVYTRRTVVWRGREFILSRNGRLLPYTFEPEIQLHGYRERRSG